jgi:hypothetical protein
MEDLEQKELNDKESELLGVQIQQELDEGFDMPEEKLREKLTKVNGFLKKGQEILEKKNGDPEVIREIKDILELNVNNIEAAKIAITIKVLGYLRKELERLKQTD